MWFWFVPPTVTLANHVCYGLWFNFAEVLQMLWQSFSVILRSWQSVKLCATTQDQRGSELSILCATSFRVCGASFTTKYGSVAFTELELFRGANGARVFLYAQFQG